MAAFYDWAEGEVLGDQHRTVHNELGYIKRGTGSPEGVETADIGSIFIRSDGGSATVLYVKESGTGNTGWVAIGTVADHLTDTSDAHDASAISILDTAAQYTATNVEDALAEVLDAEQAHEADTADAHDASAISILDTANDFTATDVEGALAELQSDAETHAAAADPHTGYRLESADHSHQSTGAQAGTLDHGLALTGLTDDDHTQYVLESEFTAVGDLLVGSGNGTLDNLAKGTTGQHLITDTGETLDLKWESQTITVGGVIDGGGAAVSTGTWIIWRVPFSCTVTAVHAQVDTGTTTVVNAGKGFVGGTTEFCSSDITVDPADAWEAGTVNQNTALVAGDALYIEIVTAGTATLVTIQVTLTRP